MQDVCQRSIFSTLLMIAVCESVACLGVNDLLDPFDEYEQDCPSWRDRTLPHTQVPWGSPERAFLTAPPGVAIQPSLIPGAGLGAVSWTFIARYTWLGEYEGEIVTDRDKISYYTWQVQRNSEVDYHIDAHDVSTSNWLRFLNCPRDEPEENVKVYECYGKMYYLTTKDVYPGTELLVHYGEAYAKELGIKYDGYSGYS